jgi:hypothetical protein
MTSGTLTVTDGTNTATIKMTGKYTKLNFSLTDDGTGHTNVTYSGTGMAVVGPPASVNQMVAAMASLGAGSPASASMVSSAALSSSQTLLSTPHG